MEVITPNIVKGMNRGAFRGELTCPHLAGAGVCGGKKWKFIEKLSSYRIRYRCGVCGGTIQYDFSSNMNHPYAVFGKNKWQRIVESWKRSRTGHASLGLKAS